MAKENMYWTNGLKIDNTLERNLKEAIQRVRNNKASMIIIDGGVGEGKTTLGVICSQIISIGFKEKFILKEQVRQGGKDFLKGMHLCVKNNKHIIVYDEAGDFNTRASLSNFNQNMNRVFETYRALGIIVILCLPSFADIDLSLMKKKIPRFLIHTYGRNDKKGKYQVYSLRRMWYLKKAMLKTTIPDDAYKIVKANFYGEFKNLNIEEARELEELSVAGKKSIIQKSMLKSKGLITSKEIAERTGYCLDSVKRFIKKNNIIGEKHTGNIVYYPESVVQAIIIQKERTNKVSL
jgi:hypothetical protein